MSDLSELRITDSDVAQHGVVSAPDKLTGSAQENKSVFDGLVSEVVKDKHNGLVDALEESLAWEPYDAEKSYVPDNKVVFNGSSYLCTTACKGVLPTNASCWRLIAAKGADGAGAGDMRKDVYDPNGVETDIFAYAAERANTYAKDETFSKAQSLSAATAQLFVTVGMTETAPTTPDEAFNILAPFVGGAVSKTTKINGVALSDDIALSTGGDVVGPVQQGDRILTPFKPNFIVAGGGGYVMFGCRYYNGYLFFGYSNQYYSWYSNDGSPTTSVCSWEDDGITLYGRFRQIGGGGISYYIST